MVGGSYVWYLVIVTIFKGLGGTKTLGGGRMQSHYRLMASHIMMRVGVTYDCCLSLYL